MGILGSISHQGKKVFCTLLYLEIFCSLETVPSKQVEDQLFLKD